MQKLIILCASALFLFSCQSNHSSEGIKLNNGEKWAVNAEMKPHVAEGEKILNDFLSQNSADYNKLAADLTSQNDKLIESCTMKGESHDELHKWLHPHMELIGKLAKANDPEAAKAIVTQIDQSFKTYQQYFK
jgi:hypothetical protein